LQVSTTDKLAELWLSLLVRSRHTTSSIAALTAPHRPAAIPAALLSPFLPGTGPALAPAPAPGARALPVPDWPSTAAHRADGDDLAALNARAHGHSDDDEGDDDVDRAGSNNNLGPLRSALKRTGRKAGFGLAPPSRRRSAATVSRTGASAAATGTRGRTRPNFCASDSEPDSDVDLGAPSRGNGARGRSRSRGPAATAGAYASAGAAGASAVKSKSDGRSLSRPRAGVVVTAAATGARVRSSSRGVPSASGSGSGSAAVRDVPQSAVRLGPRSRLAQLNGSSAGGAQYSDAAHGDAVTPARPRAGLGRPSLGTAVRRR